MKYMLQTKLLLFAFALQIAAPQPLIPGVRALIAKNDFPHAETLVRDYQKANGNTPEALEALSWLARGSLAQKQYQQADAYARETYRLCVEAVRSRRVDAEEHLPIALGAAIEVEAQSMAAFGKRAEAVAYLKNELINWRETSIATRIQKNVNDLSLVGAMPAPLESKEWLGPKPVTLASLKGKPVLLFFWAHWCPDCKIQGPILAQLKQKYGRKGLVVVAPTQRYGYVAGGTEASPEKEKAYIDQIRHKYYAGLLDVQAPLSQENFKIYGVSTTPTLVLLDRQGIVRMYHPGGVPLLALEAEIKKLL
jgi:thiol-disulfide isomerase/thioredoxin